VVSNIQAVILCGGMGTRIREATESRPKPMIEVGGKPLLWHIMKMYSHYGINDFVLCLGYKQEVIRDYFLNHEALNTNMTIDFSSRNKILFHDSLKEREWKVTLVDTGLNAMTGARVKKIEKFISNDVFMLTYGDGISDINVQSLLDFHKKHGKIGTVTGVRPPSRFGELVLDGDTVKAFAEKPESFTDQRFINGGFFVLNKEFFRYLSDDDSCVLEKEPLGNLAKDNQLMVFKHNGFWQCMDTYRDLMLLENLWNTKPPWRVWNA